MQTNVIDYLNEIVHKVPEKLAFSNGEEGLSFREVYDQSRSIGTYLHNNGIYKEPVVVFMNKHPKTITAFLGIITGGNYYVPIDSEMPEVRIGLILENIQSKLMICDNETIEVAKKFKFDGKLVTYDEICHEEVNDQAMQEIRDNALDIDPIYIVFTSGSTGIPKGVVVCHRSVIDFIENLSDVLEFNENTIFGNQAPLYVDAILKEVYPTLKFGATTYLIPKEYFMFPIKLVEFINEYKINTLCWVVSAFTMISAFGTFKTVVPKFVHTIAFVSEVFPIKQFNRWKEVLPNAKYVNLYGPTEGTGVCCYYEVDREFSLEERIPVGKPFKNTQILLLDEEGKQVPKGAEGEICIRGTSVVLGYYNDAEKTANSFVQNPLHSFYPEAIYKTGDIGRYNERGELEFVSRKDYQIKHMGQRIELGEIEVNVNMLDGIKQAACVYDDKKNKIVLYYVGTVESADLAVSLKASLPRYMIPNNIIKLDQIPMTTNGKIDRVTLKNMAQKK